MAHVIFAGLGFGGLYTLRHLLGNLPEGTRVTAIDPRERFVFTPLLYEYLTGELEADVVAPRYDSLLPEGKVELRREAVEHLDIPGSRLRLSNGESLDYDVLVFAPGSAPAFHRVEGAEVHGIPFYSFDDAERLKTTLRIREWASGGLQAYVVGGGVVGIELAFALAEFLKQSSYTGPQPGVIVLEAMPEILREFSDGMRRMAKRKLEEAGVEVRTSIRVLEVGDEWVTYSDGGISRMEAAVVAWAAGIQPSPLLEQLPAERHGRHGIRVEPTLQLPGFPNVFILGDAISYPGVVERAPLPDTAQAAFQQAEIASKNVLEAIEGGFAREEYRYGHLGDFLRVGRGEAIADVKGVVLDGAAGGLARRAAYLFRMPDWAIRTSAIRQWLT